MDRRRNLEIGNISHLADRLCCLKRNHLGLVMQPALKQLVHGLSQSLVVLRDLCRQSDQHHNRGGVLDLASGELLHHLHQSHPIVRAHLVKQPNGMILGHSGALRGGRGRAKSEREPARFRSGENSLLGLVCPSTDDIAGGGEKVVRGYDCCGGNRGCFVDNCRLDKSLDSLNGGTLDFKTLA